MAGLHILDTNASHDLIVSPGSDLSADRTLTIVTGDSNRSVTLSGDTTLSGTNTGDQTITLQGEVTGTGTGTFTATVDKTAITGKSQVTAVGADEILITDASDSGNLKRALVSNLVLAVASTDNAVARFDSTAGQVQNSVVTIADTSGNMAGVGTLNTHTIPGGTGTLALTSDLHSAVTVSGTPDYITLSGQDIVRGQIDLTADVTGDLPLSNLAQFAESRIAGRAVGAGTGDLTALTLLQVVTFLNTPVAITSSSNSTAWNSDNARIFTHVMTENTTIAASSGTPFNGQIVLFRIQKKSTYTLAWNAQFRAGTDFSDTIPTINATADDFHYYLFIYNGTDTAFDLLASTPGN